jgi:hypothetical protein
MKKYKKRIGWVLCALCISLVLGAIDCWLSGTSFRNTFFSITTSKLRDGGTTSHVGLGYSLVYYRKMNGERGPEIWYWFLPFSIYQTSERTGVRWLFFSETSLKEPKYQGLKLSQWIDMYFDGFHPIPDAKKIDAAKLGIRSIGTNAIPTLIIWLADDHPGNHPSRRACEVFEILGAIARPAGPALVELTRNKNEKTRYYAFKCLQLIKSGDEIMIPALKQLVHDADKNIAEEAANLLINLDTNKVNSAGVYLHEK